MLQHSATGLFLLAYNMWKQMLVVYKSYKTDSCSLTPERCGHVFAENVIVVNMFEEYREVLLNRLFMNSETEQMYT